MGERIVDRYAVHSALDPHFPRRDRSRTRSWIALARKIERTGEGPDLFPVLGRRSGSAAGEFDKFLSCVSDTDAYLDDLLVFVPSQLASILRPLPATRGAVDLRSLFRACFHGRDARTRFEAQRKLYLSKLLFTVDHCRSVKDGRRHQMLLREHLETSLGLSSDPSSVVEICCRFVPHPDGSGSLRMLESGTSEAHCWRFDVRALPADGVSPSLEVFHHDVRFKRDPMAATPSRSGSGRLALDSDALLSEPRRRSGSILTKMLSRGFDRPDQVQDVLGAMFIVADRSQAYGLDRRIGHLMGGPLWSRDRTDTLGSERDRDRMSTRSTPGFQVLKQTVDFLVADTVDGAAYHVPTEIQVYPLESYLGTLHDQHYASHRAYKRRQVLQDVLPLLFPQDVYGDSLQRVLEDY